MNTSNIDVLQYGDEAVQRPIETVLDDSAALEPMSKNKRKKKKKQKAAPSGKTVILVAGGFKGYTGDAEEIAAINGNTWEPHTVDFEATAKFSSNYVSIRDAGEFIGTLEDVRGKIGRVVFIGHGSPEDLGLSGGRTGGSIMRFTEKLGEDEIDQFQTNIKDNIIPKLDENATIDIVACNIGVGKSFIAKLAKSFNRCVRAFSGPVYWEHPIDSEKKKIANRGRVSSDNNNFRDGIRGLAFTVEICP